MVSEQKIAGLPTHNISLFNMFHMAVSLGQQSGIRDSCRIVDKT